MLGMTALEAKTQLMIVFAAIQKLEGRFDKNDVLAKLSNEEFRNVVTAYTRENIASFLWRLREEGHIMVLEKGQGHRQSVYEKAET